MMKQSANEFQKTQAAANARFAKNASRASRASESEPRVIALELAALIAPHRGQRRLTIRVENLPQSARLSAGQNNGDGTWSLALDELEGLSYFPPESAADEHTLTIRLIAKDESGATTIALLDCPVALGATDASTPASKLVSFAAKKKPADRAHDEHLLEEVRQLKSALTERDEALAQALASSAQADSRWQNKIDVTLAAAEINWKRDEAQRLTAATAQLQSEFDRVLAESAQRATDADDDRRQKDATVLQELRQQSVALTDMLADRDAQLSRLQAHADALRLDAQQELGAAKALAAAEHAAALAAALATAEMSWREQAEQSLAAVLAERQTADAAQAGAREADLLAAHQAELADLQAQIERTREEAQGAVAAAKTEAEAEHARILADAQLQWRDQAAQMVADLTAQCEAAQNALAAAQAAATASADQDDGLTLLLARFERLQQDTKVEIAAAKAQADAEHTRRMKDAETAWRQQTAQALEEIKAQRDAAQRALAGARAADMSEKHEAELTKLLTRFERLQQDRQAEIAAAKAQAEAEHGERMKAAQATWQEQADRALAASNARCETAEAALASERLAAAGATNNDAYVNSLNREIRSLRATLVDREAAIVQAQASLEQMRRGADVTSPGSRWQPLTNRQPVGDEEPAERQSSHLLRDVVFAIVVAVAAVFLFPRIEALLPDSVRGNIDNLTATLDSLKPQAAGTAAAPATAPAAAAAPQPMVTVVKAVNVHSGPAANEAVVAILKRGVQAPLLEKRGNWDRIQISAPGGSSQDGWVYSSYVTDGVDGAPKP
jgi:hypothetical protein